MNNDKKENAEEFSNYSDKELLEIHAFMDCEKFPTRFNSLVVEMKSRNILPEFTEKSSTKENINKIDRKIIDSNEIVSYAWIRRNEHEMTNGANIGKKILYSALVSIFIVTVMRTSYIIGNRGRMQSRSSEMPINEALDYLIISAPSSVIGWLVLFVIALIYFLKKKNQPTLAICNACHSLNTPAYIGANCICGGIHEDADKWKMVKE